MRRAAHNPTRHQGPPPRIQALQVSTRRHTSYYRPHEHDNCRRDHQIQAPGPESLASRTAPWSAALDLLVMLTSRLPQDSPPATAPASATMPQAGCAGQGDGPHEKGGRLAAAIR